MQPIPQHLIESALALTGKTMEDVEVIALVGPYRESENMFSISDFFYYLVSPEFIEKYALIAYEWSDDHYKYQASGQIGKAIYEYQSGNSAPIISLLTKI